MKTKSLSALSALFFCVFFFGNIGNGWGQTTVNYAQRVEYYDAGSIFTSNTAGAFNQGTHQLGMYANSYASPKRVVAWRKIKTSGDNVGSDRALQVGDEFSITLSANTVLGQMGFALLASPLTRGSWENRIENASVSIRLENYGFWYATFSNGTNINGSASSGSANVGGTSSYKNFTFTCLLTAPNRMNITITDGSITSTLNDVLLNYSNPITEFSIFLEDDWNGSEHKDIYWNTNPTANSDYIKNTGSLTIGSSNGSFTIFDAIHDGLVANSTSSVSVNNLIKEGTGSIELTESNMYTGLTTVNDGTLRLNKTGGGTLPSGNSITVNSGGTLRISSNQTLADLTIASGGSVVVDADVQLTLTGTLTNNGTLTLENGATLLQTGSNANQGSSGTYTVKQDITGSNSSGTPNGRGWYMGSPVNGASSSVFNPSANGNKVFHWDATQVSPNWSQHTSGAIMDVGKGYAVRVGESSSTITFSSSTLNNAPSSSEINIPCYKQSSTTYQGYNLVCNPFPSYLDWNDVWTGTNATNFESTIYYRVANGSDVMVFDTYNALNGQGTENTSGLGSNSNGSNATQYIPPMQAFWVKVANSVSASSNAVNLTLNNSMRDHYTSVANGGWSAGLKSTAQDFPMFLRLNIEQGSFKDQMLVFLKQQASSQYDAYDSEKMFLSGYPQVYTKVGTHKLVFNGLNSNKKITVIPVIVDIPTSGVYTFRADEFNVENGLILLEDKQEGITQDLTINDVYTFYSDAGTISNRFFIRFHQLDPSISAQGPSNSWVQDENEINEGGSIVVATNGRGKVTIHQDIDPLASKESHVVIRDAAGREVLRDKLSGLETIFQLDVPTGVYFVEIQLHDQLEIKKIFVQQ